MPMEFDLEGIDGEQFSRVMEALAGSDLEECEIEQGDMKLYLRRRVREANPSTRPSSNPSPAEERAPEEPGLVRAQTVGIFYRSEKRSAPARVEVGARVKAGDVLGYIEVMTIPHTVPSPYEGIVESFLVEDGQPAEYGQPLVSIQLSAVSGQQSAVSN